MAAANPAPPAPITTTSVSSGSFTSLVHEAGSRFFQSSELSPRVSRALPTAVRNAMDVRVAPEMVSTARVWLSTMALVIFSMATSPMPGVSRESSTVMRSMAPSFMATSTVNLPCLPMPSPVAVVALAASLPAAASSFFFAAASSWLMGAQPASANVPPSAAMAPPAMNCLREQPDMMTSLGRTSSATTVPDRSETAAVRYRLPIVADGFPPPWLPSMASS